MSFLTTSIFSTTATIVQVLIMFAAAIVLGLLNAIVFTRKSNTSRSFKLTLALLPLAVSVVIFMINGNIGVGVAVAGAFALTRFRSQEGSAREIVAIFTDMALGLILGMGYIWVAAIFFIIEAAFALILMNTKFGGGKGAEKQLKITIPEDMNYDGLFDDLFKKYTEENKLMSVKTAKMGTLYELTYKVTFKGDQIPKAFMDDVRVRNGNLPVVINMVPEGRTL